LREGGKTIAAGVISKLLPDEAYPEITDKKTSKPGVVAKKK
jgi:hypothetical protein